MKELKNRLKTLEDENGFLRMEIAQLKATTEEVVNRIKGSYRFLLVEFVLLWLFEIISCIEIIKLRG